MGGSVFFLTVQQCVCADEQVNLQSGEMAKEIFLSYGRETEVAYFVKRLKTDLESEG